MKMVAQSGLFFRMVTAALFPGQGSQQAGMGRDLIAQSSLVRQLYQTADDILDMPITRICCNGGAHALRDTAVQQPALFVTSMARWQMWQQTGNVVHYMAGHSMGQLTALTAAGSLTFEDGLRLAYQRGRIMQATGEKRPGSMAAILKLPLETVQDICQQVRRLDGQVVTVGNDNCPGQTVISGDTAAVQHAAALAKKQRGRALVLPISIASHSALMAAATVPFHDLLTALPIAQPHVPVIGNLTAAPMTTPAAIRYELKYILTRRVRWTQSMRWLIENGVEQMVEIGPGKVLAGLLKRIDPTVKRRTYTPSSDHAYR